MFNLIRYFNLKFEKKLTKAQGRIWDIDSELYHKQEKAINDKIKKMNLNNAKVILGQIRNQRNKRMKENRMTLTEYSINKNEIEQVINGIESK